MKAFRILGNNIKDAFKSVFRNLSLSIASISCISITLVLVAVAILLKENVDGFTSDIEKDVTIVVFIERNTSEEDINTLKTNIEGLSNIDSITFLSKNDIKDEMSTDAEEISKILEEYTDENNPLLDEYLVKVKETEKISITAKEIQNMDKVYQVKYGEGMVEELVKIFDIVKKIMIVVVISLVVVTAFLISNTIKISINSRKRQIEIMRLVGASNTYIKLPFFIEGIILGVLGSILPVVGVSYGYIYLYDKMNGVLFTEVISLINPDSILLNLIIVTSLIGIIVGALGSSRAVRRHLKI